MLALAFKMGWCWGVDLPAEILFYALAIIMSGVLINGYFSFIMTAFCIIIFTIINYLQIYTPASRDCIAIEPMTCAANAFNNGMGTISLKAGEKKSVAYGVYLK